MLSYWESDFFDFVDLFTDFINSALNKFTRFEWSGQQRKFLFF